MPSKSNWTFCVVKLKQPLKSVSLLLPTLLSRGKQNNYKKLRSKSTEKKPKLKETLESKLKQRMKNLDLIVRGSLSRKGPGLGEQQLQKPVRRSRKIILCGKG